MTAEAFLKRQAAESVVARRRREQWLRLTGLLPPEEREDAKLPEQKQKNVSEGYSAAVRKGGKPPPSDEESILPGTHRSRGGTWRRKKYPDGDAGPGWDNVVRAYEEDRDE